jgi:hypothetical protein
VSTAILRQDGLAVADGVLAEAGLRRLRRYVSNVDYRDVHSRKWDKVWRLWDGAPQRGESVYFDPERVFGWNGPVYPTSTPMDLLIEEVVRWAAANPEICGVQGLDWLGLYLCPWLYPPGSALSLHQDAVAYSGSFTFFVHARWSVHWGGELLVYPSASAWPAGPGPDDGEPWLSDDHDGDLEGPGIATAIHPRPNRLVLIGDNRPHRVARVDGLAGGHVRASISGFFLKAPP